MRLPFFRTNRRQQVEQLYRELAPSLVAYARSFGIEHSVAEDAVQRTFLALLEKNEELREARPYLFRAVRNALLNQIRDGARETELIGDEPWFHTATLDRAAELDLRRALATLSSEQREVVMLHIWGGLTFEEVGAALEISANTAASRYRYGLAALKKMLTATGLKEKV